METMLKKRDLELDRLRGIAMLWVVVVHCLYWAGVYSFEPVNLVKSFVLFEMPLFFFVSGASNGVSKSKVDYFSFVKKRFLKILLPYWIYGFFCCILTVLNCYSTAPVTVQQVFRILGSWVIPMDTQICTLSYLTWALWFIPTYLIIVLLLPGLKIIRETKFRFLVLGGIIVLYFVSLLGSNALIQKVLFFVIWTYIGLFYEDIKRVILIEHRGKRRLLLLGIVSVICLYLCYQSGYSMDMQVNKFPPNIAFFCYSFSAMSFLGVMWPLINSLLEKITNKFWNKIFEAYSNNSMTIFLYQTFVFTIMIPFGKIFFPGWGYVIEGIQLVFYLFTVIPLCALCAKIFGRFENIKIN